MSKIYLFDVDGVIVNSDYFTVKYCQDFEVKMSEFQAFFNNEFIACLTGYKDLKEEIKPWLKKWSWTKSVEEFLTYWFEAENKLNLELLEQIKNLSQNNNRLFLATNQEKYRVSYLNKEMGLNKYFEKTYSSSLIGYTKPNEFFFNFIINDLKTNPEKIHFYDDSLENVEAAKRLGIHSNLYKIGDKIL
jgi:putative hydrolase of the HAD superfamily